ncbi:MAG: mannose-6-phosphate isomerase, class I [SAR324 cluster bacterium]|nr:mannose-6-phosphate isomerase, class I [SAR324 cluster bacterium]
MKKTIDQSDMKTPALFKLEDQANDYQWNEQESIKEQLASKLQTNSAFELVGGAMHYDWGKLGSESLATQLMPDAAIDQTKPYAELWMGVHPNQPSRVKFGNGEWLSDVLMKNRALLGNYTFERWGTLPFLLKVLSIAKPLSIQIHPDKMWAKRLHSQAPNHYPDDNHKPEIAMPLTTLEMLYGLEKQDAWKNILSKYPPLSKYCSKIGYTPSVILPDLLSLPENEENKLLEDLYTYLQKKQNVEAKEKLFLSLYPQYPNDLGLLFIFFMRFLTVEPGNTIFIQTNHLHSYLSGDLVECMANSDNAIRAGITSKYKDVKQLLSELSYDDHAPQLSSGIVDSQYVTRFPTDAEEFEMQEIKLPKNRSLLQGKHPVPSILLTLSGQGKISSNHGNLMIKKGSAVFVGANHSYGISASDDLRVIRASVPFPEDQ